MTVTNSTSGGLSILSLLNHNALGSGGAVSALAPISLNSTGGAGSIASNNGTGGAILEIGATLDPTAANSFSYMVVPAGQIPTGGQISLGSSGNTQDVVGFSASSATYAPRTVGLYTSTSLTTLQTLQRGTYLPGNLVLGSSDANTTLILQNPIDLYSASAGSSVLFSSIRGTASPTPEGEYAGAISNSSSAPVSVTFGGSGGLIFASSAQHLQCHQSAARRGRAVHHRPRPCRRPDRRASGHEHGRAGDRRHEWEQRHGQRGQPGLHDRRAQQPDYRQQSVGVGQQP